jgi:hypothetical protein
VKQIDADGAAHPIAIVQDRYGGSYSRGSWLAIANADREDCNGKTRVNYCMNDGPSGGDCSAMLFWTMDAPGWIAAGNTPQEAVDNLLAARDKWDEQE